jgi:hypothetical protein
VARNTGRKAPNTQSVQTAVEGVVENDGKVEFMGAYFKMADRIGLMPLLKFAHASSKGVDSTDMEGLAALYSMIRDCIDQEKPTEERPNPETGELETVPVGPSEFDRFETHATEMKAEADDLMSLVQRVIEAIAARPTRPPGDSSAGRQTTSENSKASSSSRVSRVLEAGGMQSVQDLAR